MTIPENMKGYSLQKKVQGHRAFFKGHPIESWSFIDYYKMLSEDSNFNLNYVYNNFISDIKWVSQLKEVPNEVKNFITDSIIPREKNFFKKGKFNAQTPMNVYNTNIFESGSVQNNHYVSEGSVKRKHEELSKDDNDVKVLNIWQCWISFLEAQDSRRFHICSPEKHKIGRCGPGVSHRPNLDSVLYEKHLKSHDRFESKISEEATDYIDLVIDSSSISVFEENIKAMPQFDNEITKNAVNFYQEIFMATLRLYKSNQSLTSSESVFNHLMIFRFMDAVALSCQNLHSCKSYFIPAEAYLSAMKLQLVNTNQYKNDRHQYKADGIISLQGFRNLEILLLETSGPFKNSDKTKISFDHHKGTFGAIAMLKTIADEYNYASIDTFTKVKVFLIHAANTSIHIWSISYRKEGVYDLWKEDTLNIKPAFSDRRDMLPETLRFYWSLKNNLQEAINNITILKANHDEIKRNFRYSKTSPPLLNNILNPFIVALHQKEHSKGAT